MTCDTRENKVKSRKIVKEGASIRYMYLEEISAIGIDTVLTEGKNYKPDCLPPVE